MPEARWGGGQRRPVEHVHDAVHRVQAPDRGRGPGHAGQAVRRQPGQLSQQPRSGQLRVSDAHGGAGAEELGRVVLLVRATERSGHEHRRQADRRELGAGAEAGPADDQVGAGHQLGHIRRRRDGPVARAGAGGGLHGALGAGQVDDLGEALEELVQGLPHRVVEAPRAEAAAHHEQPPGRQAGRPPGERPPDRVAGADRAPRGEPVHVGREADARGGGPPPQHLVGQPAGLGDLEHVRHTASERRPQARHHRVGADPEDDLWLEPVEGAQPAGQRPGQDEWEQRVAPARVAVQAPDADGLQPELGARDHLLLDAAVPADQQDVAVRMPRSKRLRDRQRGRDVAAGRPSRDQEPHRVSS